MGLIRRTLELLLPPGHAWRLPAGTGQLVDGLADTIERPRAVIRAALAEALPGTATLMLPEWHEALGQRYDPTQTLEFQRRMLAALISSIGSSTLNAFNEQMHKELAGVDITEISASSECGVAECGVEECGAGEGIVNPWMYLITGTVENDAEAARVASVISHFGPLHLTPHSLLVILSDTGTAECGIDVCGIAECGSTG